MSVNINDLDLVQEGVEVDHDNYPDPQEFPPPVPEGVYVLSQGEPEFSSTQEKFLSALMDHQIAVGEFQGRQVRYDRVSNKPFERGGAKVSMMDDHLHALGQRGQFAGPGHEAHQRYADALANSTGKLFKAQLQWEASCPDCVVKDADGNPVLRNRQPQRIRVRGARRFPRDEQGNLIPDVPCPGCGQSLTAFVRITRRIPA